MRTAHFHGSCPERNTILVHAQGRCIKPVHEATNIPVNEATSIPVHSTKDKNSDFSILVQ